MEGGNDIEFGEPVRLADPFSVSWINGRGYRSFFVSLLSAR
jgi:hypothetical protein